MVAAAKEIHWVNRGGEAPANRRSGYWVRVSILSVALAVSASLFQVRAEGLKSAIGPQSLAVALEVFAKATGYQLVYRAQLVGGRATQGAAVGLPVPDTLRQLLRGTNLTFRFVNAHTVAIVVAAAGSGAETRTPAQQAESPRRPPPDDNDSIGASKGADTGKAGILGRIAALFAHCGRLFAAGPSSCRNPSAGIAPVMLQEVLVTAERRAADEQATPIAVTALSGARLWDQHLDTVTNLQTVAPITVSQSGWHQQINVRGIGNSVISAAVNTGIAVIRDGLFEAETTGQNEPFYDIQDVEVLRGPQGTFVGYSSTGGAVEINSVNPTFQGVTGYVAGQLGDYSDRKIQGAINLPAGERFAVRVAFNRERRNSFYRSYGPHSDSGSIDYREARLSLLWRPTDSFQALAKLAYDDEQTGGLPSQVDQGTFTDPTTGATVHAPYYEDSTHQPFVLNSDRSDAAFNTLKRAEGLELRYTLPDGIVLRSLSGLEHINTGLIQDIDATYVAAQWQFREVGPNDNYYSEELNVISPTTGAVSGIAGSTWFYRNTPVDSASYDGLAPYSLAAPQSVIGATGSVQRIAGLFGQVTWRVAHSLQLEIGARANWDNNFNYGSTAAFNPLINQTRASPNSGYYRDLVPTGKVNLSWAPVPSQHFYAFYARGYKSGGTNNGTLHFRPEHVDDYELGWKGKLLQGHVLTQVGGYWMSYQDYQYSILDTASGQINVTNLPAATIKGIEASMQSRLGYLGLDLGVYYNDSSLGALNPVATYKLPASLPVNTPQCVGAQTPNCFNYAPYIENVSGETNAFSPKLTANASIEYNIPLRDASLTPRVSYSHMDKQYASIFQTDTFFLMSARNLWGADLQYAAGPWTVDLYGQNLTNDVYVSGFYGSATRINDVFYGDPRQLGVRFTLNF